MFIPSLSNTSPVFLTTSQYTTYKLSDESLASWVNKAIKMIAFIAWQDRISTGADRYRMNFLLFKNMQINNRMFG